MTGTVGLRASALAGVALLALAIALAVNHHNKHGQSLPTPAGQWYTALAAPYTPSAKTKKGACGVAIGPKTAGVAHPQLPCGVKIYISYRGTKVLTQVIDRGLKAPGREFYVTKALADKIGLHGTRSLRWTYAR